ncbi:MAG: flagellar protein FlaG [Chloroflexota bacterium]
MNDKALGAISNNTYRPPENSTSPRTSGQAESGFTPTAASVSKATVTAQEKIATQESKTPRAAESVAAPLVGNASNVSLQFRVDDKTKDVTVFVVDRKSKKVLRSIPANELAKLQSGDLLKLTA